MKLGCQPAGMNLKDSGPHFVRRNVLVVSGVPVELAKRVEATFGVLCGFHASDKKGYFRAGRRAVNLAVSFFPVHSHLSISSPGISVTPFTSLSFLLKKATQPLLWTSSGE